jgi:hypothetical protein
VLPGFHYSLVILICVHLGRQLGLIKVASHGINAVKINGYIDITVNQRAKPTLVDHLSH